MNQTHFFFCVGVGKNLPYTKEKMTLACETSFDTMVATLYIWAPHSTIHKMEILSYIYHFSDSPNYSEIHEILSRFMDYPHNSSEVKAMELLTAVLANTTSSSDRQTTKPSS